MVWYGSMYSFLKQPVWQVWFTSWSCHWGDWQNNTQLKCSLELKDNGSNNSLFLSCQMGLSDGTFFMIKHTLSPNENSRISSPICPMGVADKLGPWLVKFPREGYKISKQHASHTPYVISLWRQNDLKLSIFMNNIIIGADFLTTPIFKTLIIIF